MTAPQDPRNRTAADHAADMGSTAQFQAFVANNDAPDEARERAAADPDGDASPPAHTGVDDDREIRFFDPVQSGPPVQSGGVEPGPAPASGAPGGSLRPDVELPPAELGSTAQFQAFASGEDVHDESRPAPAPAAPQSRPHPEPAGAPDALQPPPLPPSDPGSKRTVLVATGVVLLVIVVVVLLFLLV